MIMNGNVFGVSLRVELRAAAVVFFLLTFARPAFSLGYNWQNVPIQGGGFVPGLVYSPVQSGLLYARTDVGGFYRWNSTAGQWVQLTNMFTGTQTENNYFGGESIAPDPVNPNIVYAAAGSNGSVNAILSSANQGTTWTINSVSFAIKGNDDGREAGERLAVDPNLDSILYFGSRSNGLWKSTNSAATWAQVTNFPVNGDADYGISWVIFPKPSGGYGNPSGSASSTIYVGVMAMSSGNSNVYYSTNAGSTWSLVAGGPSNMITPHASLGTDGNLWIVYGSGGYGPSGISSGQIWKLDTSTISNATPTWVNRTPSGGPCSGCGGYGGISVDAENPNHALITTLDWWGGPDRLFSTSNGGSSWSVVALANSSYSTYNDNGAGYLYGCSNPSSPGGVGWAGCVAIDPFNSNNAIYPSGGNVAGGGVWSSTNIQSSPVTWNYTDNNLEETVPLYMNASAAQNILFECLGDVGGLRAANLTQPPSSVFCTPQVSNCNMLDFAESNPNSAVMVGYSNNPSTVDDDIGYSTNNGVSWTPWGSVPSGYGTVGQMGCVAVAADGSKVVVSPYGTSNGYPSWAAFPAGSWTTCNGLPQGAMVAADRSTAANFYATSPSEWVYGGTVTIYESTDYGKNFTQVNTISVGMGDNNGNGQWVMPRSVFGEPGEFWISTYDALYRCTGGGTTVTKISTVYEPMGPVGFGKAAPGQTHPAVYLSGSVNGTYGFYRCDDGVGTSWTQINDANHEYGNPGWMEGDENIYGRCYVGAGGHGILYGDISATATATGTDTPTPTTSKTNSPSPTSTVTLTPFQSASPTGTATSTGTSSRTATVSASPSPMASASATATSSPTVTSSFTESPVDSPTDTSTSTPIFTVSVSATVTATGTPSASPSISPTGTPCPTPSPTGFPSRSPTGSATPSASPDPSVSPSSEATPVASATETATLGITATLTSSPTPTWTSTATATWTLMAAFTPSETLSATAGNTGTATASPTPGPVVSGLSPNSGPVGVTITVSGYGFLPGSEVLVGAANGVGGVQAQVLGVSGTTLTVVMPDLSGTVQVLVENPLGGGQEDQSNSLSFTYTNPKATATPSGGGSLVILRAVPVPNPNPTTVAIDLEGAADDVKGTLFSVAENAVDEIHWGPQSEGWKRLSLPSSIAKLSSGLYYLRLQATRGPAVSKAVVIKMVLLK
jgi:hypothetical protein